jgi:hypothetical protein
VFIIYRVQQLLDFVGLPMENGLLDFHKKPKHQVVEISTASLKQAREPVHNNNVGKWVRLYGPYAGELKRLYDNVSIDDLQAGFQPVLGLEDLQEEATQVTVRHFIPNNFHNMS